jgi:hypothetical protein
MKKLLAALICAFTMAAFAQESCTLPRTASGDIKRSASEVRAFKKLNACPSTGKNIGTCPGYQVEHTLPLCSCGPDKVSNMTWMATAEHKIKTKADVKHCAELKKTGAVK